MWLQRSHQLAARSSANHTTPSLRTAPSANHYSKYRKHATLHVFDKFRDFVHKYSGVSRPESNAQPDAEEGAELVRIDTESSGGLGGTSDEVLGPLAVLLVGFLPEEFEAFRAMMNDIEADMVKIVPCTRAHLDSTLQAALESDYPHYEQPALGQRRALFMSGMYGSEVVELIAAYKEAGLPPCAFAAAVPNNYQRTVGDLAESVWRDQAALVAKQQLSAEGAAEDSY